MSELPSGTVTFLFTDIEGSTALWERDQLAMARALDRHLAILRQFVKAYGGLLFKTIGDGTQSAFASAPAALGAALAAQQALMSETWPDPPGPLLVRMALHTGEAEPRDGDYLAAPLNRLARLLSLARGEQILLTEATARLVQDSLPRQASLRDLGETPLRDLERAERVFALLHPDLPADVALPPAPDRKLRHFPAAVTPFVGREPLVQAVKTLLATPDVRLVTLTGPGGTGKTRLASRVAEEVSAQWADGAVFVDLAPVHDPALILSTIATALDLREAAGRSLMEIVRDYLSQRTLLLVIDNAEHLLAGATVISEILAVSPQVEVLATSRSPLRLRGEREYPVPPLHLPALSDAPDLAALAANEAVALFVDRAQAVRADFALTPENSRAVAEICARLDGLPLAIELAAAKVKILPPAALLSRLERRLPLLTGGPRDAPERQRTLRDAIDWSYDLLAPPEQRFFSQLSVFVGGWTLDAAAAIADGDAEPDLVIDGLTALVDNSLVRLTADGPEMRYGMLETIREFGLERLAAGGEEVDVRSRLADWCLEFAERAGSQARGPRAADWLPILQAEHGNLRSSLAWLVAQRDGLRLIRLAGAVWPYWQEHAHYSEGRRWLQAALELGQEALAPHRLRALTGSGILAWYQADMAYSRQMHEQALTLARAIGDRAAEAFELGSLGAHAGEAGDYDLAAGLYEQSLAIARDIGEAGPVVVALHNLAHQDWERGDISRARGRLEEALAVAREQHVGWILPSILVGIGTIATDLGDAPKAIESFRESLALAQTRGNLGDVIDAIEGLGRVAAAVSRHEEAARLLGAADAMRQSLAAPHSPSELVTIEPLTNALRDALGAERFAKAWADGQALSRQEAIATALAVDTGPK